MRRPTAACARCARVGVLVLLISLAHGASPAPATTGPGGASFAPQDDTRPVSGRIKILVDADEPILTVVSRWGWFPLEEYPFDQIGNSEGPRIDPRILAAYVNFGCHFEGYVKWDFEELETEVLEDGRVRRRLKLTRGPQGGFYNNNLKFKCEIATKSRRVNRLLGVLLTGGGAPAAGFQSSLVQVVWLKALQVINTLPRTEGSWSNYLYETFKSFLTFNLMDRDEAEVDLYFSADGEQLEFELSRDRTAVFKR